MPKKFLRVDAYKLVIIQFLVGFVLWYGIEKTFIRNELGFGAFAISLIVATYMVIALIFEVPSGILADKWGRRNVLVTSIALFILADIILGLATNLAVYLIGTLVWGFFSVMLSGTMESITYDSLKEKGEEKRFQKVDAYQRAAFMIGIFISSALAGIIGPLLSLRSTYFLSIIPVVVALFIAISIKEPKLSEAMGDTRVITHARKAFSLILRSKSLRSVAIFLSVVLVIDNFLDEYSQYYYLALFHNNVTIAAILTGVSGLFLAAGFAVASRVKRFELMIIGSGVLMAIAGGWHNAWALVGFCLIYPLVAIAENRSQTALQHGLTSDVRTASTSVVNFLAGCIIIPLTFGFSWLIDHYGAQEAYLIAGLVFVLVGSVFIFKKLSARGEMKVPNETLDLSPKL